MFFAQQSYCFLRVLFLLKNDSLLTPSLTPLLSALLPFSSIPTSCYVLLYRGKVDKIQNFTDNKKTAKIINNSQVIICELIKRNGHQQFQPIYLMLIQSFQKQQQRGHWLHSSLFSNCLPTNFILPHHCSSFSGLWVITLSPIFTSYLRIFRAKLARLSH